MSKKIKYEEYGNCGKFIGGRMSGKSALNDELTPLEVSKQLKDFVLEFVKNGLDRIFIHGSFATIETELKRLEEIDKVMFLNNQKMQKQDEILRIIKEKRVDISLLLGSSDLETYNLHIYSRKHGGLIDYKLTKAEFDLLKKYF